MSTITIPADTDPLLSPPPDNTSPKSNLDRPSYTDDPIEIESNGPDSLTSNSNTKPIQYIKISVSNPQKELDPTKTNLLPGNNNSTFVTYLISTKTNVPEFNGASFVVRRRFRDFVTLSDRLNESYRGFFIPPRPDKSVVEGQVMQKQEFVEHRRTSLEKYLRRLASHPMIGKSDELRVFLQAQGKLPLPTSVDVASRILDGASSLPRQLMGGSGSLVKPQDVVQPARGGRDLLRIFRELKQSVSNDYWGGAKVVIEEGDKEFLEKKERLKNLEVQISDTSKQAESLVSSQQKMAETMGELGLALLKLTKLENQNATLNTQRIRANDMKNAATVTVKASRLYRGLSAQTVQHLDTLHEYLGLMLAVDAAFSDRSSALLTVQILISDISSLHSKADKVTSASSKIFGNDNNKGHKVEELREKIRVTEDAKSCGIREYERIKENNKTEIERFDRERKVDFLKMLKGFVTNQVTYTEKVATEWTKIVEGTDHYVKKSG